MKNIIDILLYNSFIKLPGSNQTFGENQGLYYFSGHVKQGENSMLHNAQPARTRESVKGNQKKTA